MAALADIRDELDTLTYRAEQIFNEANQGGSLDFSQVKAVDGTEEEKRKKWTGLQFRINELAVEKAELEKIDAQMRKVVADNQRERTPVNTPPWLEEAAWRKAPQVSIKEALAGSSEFRKLRETKAGTARIELPEYKTLITLTTVSPQNQRQGAVNMRLEERTVLDMIGETQADAATVEWYEETTVTNAAAAVPEGDAKPESALAWTLRTTAIKTLATWIPVTVQALDDNAFLEGQIRSRLVYMIQRHEEAQVLNGTGGNGLTGILQNGSIQTQAKGADSVPAAIFKAIQKVRGATGAGFLEPDGIVMHPNDYTDFYTLQDTTGNFVLQAILQQNEDPRIWGFPIRQTTAMTENTALVGAFGVGAEIYRRGGLSVAASTEHASYFVENKVAIRAESRIGLAVEIPTAFCTVTGI